jgi:FkbM family methyltransferase
VLYEADTDAIAAIHQAGKNRPSELIAIPGCLADRDGDGLLHIYANPGLTSLRELNRVLDHRYQNTIGVDFQFGDGGAKLLQKRKVATRRLDGLIAGPGTPCPPPDFLSLDVQSGEYEVLLDARDALEQSICGLIVEDRQFRAGLRRFRFTAPATAARPCRRSSASNSRSTWSSRNPA